MNTSVEFPAKRHFSVYIWGWLGVGKVLGILRHRGVQLILASGWARPAVFVAGKGRGGNVFYFFRFFSFIPVPLSSLSLSFISSNITSISFLPFSGRRHKMIHKGLHVIKPQHNQSVSVYICTVMRSIHATKKCPGLLC